MDSSATGGTSSPPIQLKNAYRSDHSYGVHSSMNLDHQKMMSQTDFNWNQKALRKSQQHLQNIQRGSQSKNRYAYENQNEEQFLGVSTLPNIMLLQGEQPKMKKAQTRHGSRKKRFQGNQFDMFFNPLKECPIKTPDLIQPNF